MGPIEIGFLPESHDRISTMTVINRPKSLIDKLKTGVMPPLQLVAILVVAYVITLFLPTNVLVRMGVVPRSLDGLWGVLFHPLLHFSHTHLMCNVMGIMIFGCIISLRSHRDFISITAASWLGGGSLLWLIGQPQSVVGGASGIVYGYLGFVLLRGVFDRRIISIVVSALTLYLFHGVLIGLLPTDVHVSWRGHACGFAVGVASAYAMKSRRRR